MWRALGLGCASELRCDVTLMSGQSFTWKRIGNDQWTGVIGQHVVQLKETEDDVIYRSFPDSELTSMLRDYFQLDTSLTDLYTSWSSACPKLKQVGMVLPGVRIIRQDPVECLFSFICSSNNNISRITLMLDRLRQNFGQKISCVDDVQYYAFPTTKALAEIKEQQLRDLGFGYRARYIVESARFLQTQGEEWLRELRGKPREEVQGALLQFTGVGRKVADCVALFSLGQTDCIPVDTHVWQIACRDYDKKLSSAKSLTPAVYQHVGDLFRRLFGSHAGWAHSLLFAGELPVFREKLAKVAASMKSAKSKSIQAAAIISSDTGTVKIKIKEEESSDNMKIHTSTALSRPSSKRKRPSDVVSRKFLKVDAVVKTEAMLLDTTSPSATTALSIAERCKLSMRVRRPTRKETR